jgi:hypothetical protein
VTGEGLARQALWLHRVLTVAGCAIIACGDAALLQADWGSAQEFAKCVV